MLVGELDEMEGPDRRNTGVFAPPSGNPRSRTYTSELGYLLWMEGQTEEPHNSFKRELDNDRQHCKPCFTWPILRFN